MLNHTLPLLHPAKALTLPAQKQYGQALVEYAILLILLVMVMMGGAELGVTAYHASKTGDGAKAAANQWAEAIGYSYAKLNQIEPIGDETITELNARVDENKQVIFDSYMLDNVNVPDIIDCTAPYAAGTFDSTNANLPIKINACNLSLAANRAHIKSAIDDIYPDTDFRNLEISDDFYPICTDALSPPTKIEDCQITGVIKWLILKNMGISASEPRLLVNKSGIVERKNLGDHSNPANFTHPNCNGTAYDNGLPDEVSIYLFNPLPIDITNCDGTAGKKAGELVSGTDTYEGLPKLNQALYSQYTKVCVDDAAGVITIQRLDGCLANGHKLWLKPPGKMCGAGTAAGTEYCPTEGDLKGATGFYFFGDSNDSGENLKYIPSSAGNEEFRPTFQLVCNGADYRDSGFDANEKCNDLVAAGTGSFSLQVQTRYRSIFESFLTFGLQELPDDYLSLLPYFYNPNNVGVAGSNQLVGTAGSEIGPIGSNKNPTVKRFRDFRGCYQVDITPPDKIGDQVRTTVSSCN